MTAQLNHTIVSCRDKKESAAFLAEILGLPEPTLWGHFAIVNADNNVSLDFMETGGEVTPQHYAFLIDDAEFDDVFGRITQRGLDYWADPGLSQKGEINHRDGGRGVYWKDPDGHLLEVLTRPYGSGY